MTLIAILAATLLAGIGSVWLAALLGFGILARYTQHMLSLAAGALLATAFMHLLPEAFESQASAHELFAALLTGLVFFFLLDKAELWHHGHEHHGNRVPRVPVEMRTDNSIRGELVEDGYRYGDDSRPQGDHSGHHHGHHHKPASGSWAVLTGDSVHCFGDGVLIASAFIADLRLGIVAALAVLVHEVPHHMGDLVVLRRGSNSTRAALFKVSMAGALTALGGIVGYFLVAQLEAYLPYFLTIASSSFVYVALADLIPQLQRQLSARQTAAQILWLGVGIGLVTVVSGLAHGR